MEAVVWDRLVVLMERMAAGDRAAIFLFYGEFGAALAGRLRQHLRRMGVDGVSRDDLDGLVIDACIVLYDCAAGWDADGGAAPWTWADRRLAGVAARFIGQHADQLDGVPVAGAAEELRPLAEGEPLEVLGALGEHAPVCSLLKEALGRVGTERDAAILLEYTIQQQAGDPSPAQTVAAQFGLSAPAVRKVVQRMRGRIRELAAAESEFAALADLPLVA